MERTNKEKLIDYIRNITDTQKLAKKIATACPSAFFKKFDCPKEIYCCEICWEKFLKGELEERK